MSKGSYYGGSMVVSRSGWVLRQGQSAVKDAPFAPRPPEPKEVVKARRAAAKTIRTARASEGQELTTRAADLLRADGLPVARVLAAVLSVLPLDDDVACPVMRSCDPAAPDRPAPVHRAMDAAASAAVGDPSRIETAHGPAFYDRVKRCYAVVATGEAAFFANIILRKGVVEPQSSHETTPR